MIYQLLCTVHHHILNLIAPQFCVSCKQFIDIRVALCDECRIKIKPVVSKIIKLTPKYEMVVMTVGAYVQPLKQLVLAKSRSNRSISYQLAQLVWDMSYIKNSEFDYVVPVPLHWTRYAWRGYNQAELIAHVIAKKTGKPLVHLLKRNKRTAYQSHFSSEARKENVKGIFSLTCQDDIYKNKKILLVDDLLTTGATLENAARPLLKLRPKKLLAVVAARVI